MRKQRVSLLARISLLFVALAVGVATPASASGPVERFLQILAHPTDPKTMVLRYGAASQGFLFSRDGGQSFALMCSSAVAPELPVNDRINRLSLRVVPASAAVTIDGSGALLFGQYGALWSDDASGCAWKKEPAFDGKWPYSIKRDAREPNLVWAAVSTTTGEAETMDTRVELTRRDAAGVWSVIAPIRKLAIGQLVLDGDLVVSADATKRRIYTSMLVAGLMGYSQAYVLVSDDDGKTWREHPLPTEQEALNLLAVDPGNPDTVLAVVGRDNQADSLLLSRDQGATFQPYGDFRTVSDVTFGPDGRVYVADAGDSGGDDTQGGLYTASKLGEPLVRVGSTQYIECVHYQALTGKMFACNRDRFGELDPSTGTIKELTRIDTVSSFLQCPGKDIQVACELQLNAGASWCCAGHYPFSRVCDEYNVTKRPDGARVYCGLAGREYDMPSDAGTGAPPRIDSGVSLPDAAVGAGLPDASGTTTSVSRDSGGPAPHGRPSKSSGCAAGGSAAPSSPASIATWGMMLFALSWIRRRHRRECRRASR